MSDTTTMRWIVSGILLVTGFGIFAAVLASGHKPSLHFTGSIVLAVLFVGLVVWTNVTSRIADRRTAEQKAKAHTLLADKDFKGAISIWKELLPQVGEQDVNELLPQLDRTYRQLGSAEGAAMLSELTRLYADFFDMTKHIKHLDAKGRTMRQSLADRICRTVNRLPAS